MPAPRSLRRVLAGLTGLAVLAGCGAGSTPSAETRTPGTSASGPGSASAAPGGGTVTPGPQTRATAALRGVDLTTGLTTPWELVSLPDGSLLTCERDTGRILRIVDGRPTELRRIADSVAGNEGGLLGLAVSPDRATVFAYYSTADDNRIVAMDFRDGALGEPRVILSGIGKGGRHNGGRMVVGPDDHLYVGTGDAGDTATAADRSSLNGKILRLTLDGQSRPRQPVRHRGLELRAPQRPGPGLRRGRPAVGQRVRRADLGRAEPDHPRRELRLAGGRGLLRHPWHGQPEGGLAHVRRLAVGPGALAGLAVDGGIARRPAVAGPGGGHRRG